MERVEDTPITAPGKKRPDTNNGVPEKRDFEDTGEILEAMSAAPDNLLEAFVGKAVEALANSDSGGGGGAAGRKAAKKQNGLILLIMLIVGPGGAVGAHYALKGQAAANTLSVEGLEKKTGDLEPRIEQTEENIRLIKVRVGTIDKSVKSIETSQTAIAGGIEELKQENVKRLIDELEDAKRELRRRDRLDRNR